MLSPKTKKIAVAVGLMLLLIMLIPLGGYLIKKVRAFPNTILYFSPATRLVANNQTFTLDARIDPRTNQLTAVEVHVTFDQTKFILDSISTTGSPFSVILQAASINNTNGNASIVVGVPATSPPTPVTADAKIATFSFLSYGGAATNSSIGFTTASVAAALGEGSVNVITNRNPSLVTVDAAAPSGGSITYTNGYINTTSASLVANDGTDAVSGINPASRIFRRRSASLSAGTCGTYSAWNSLTPAGTYPNFTDSTLVNGNCYQYQYLVTDNVGNQATYTGTSTIRVDTLAPTLTQVTPVPALTNDTTPNYTFNSSEAGTIVYGGDCSSATTSAVSGNNTVTFNALSSATHSNCTIRVTDAAGNQSAVLNVNSFTVDAIAPTITSVSSDAPNVTYGLGSLIDIDVNFSEAVTATGNVTVMLDTGRNCSFLISNSNSGTCTYTVQTGDVSGDLTTTSISGTIRDQAGNDLTNFTPGTNLGANKNIVVSALAPVLTQITAVPSITNNPTPAYTFSSTKSGTITYSGDCSSNTTTAVSGNNTVIFNTLAVGYHTNCVITVRDATSLTSLPLNVSSFSITYPADLNTDRIVNIFDYNIFIPNFGNTNCGNISDIDKNCAVNIFDYNLIIGDFGKSF